MSKITPDSNNFLQGPHPSSGFLPAHAAGVTAPCQMALINAANHHHTQSEASAQQAYAFQRSAVAHLLALGEALTLLKHQTNHGDWGKLFQPNDSNLHHSANLANVHHGGHLHHGANSENVNHGSQIETTVSNSHHSANLPNTNLGSLLTFNRKYAHRVMKTWERWAAQDGVRSFRSNAIPQIANADAFALINAMPPDEFDASTDGAESPRQLMLNLGIITTRADFFDPDPAAALAPVTKHRMGKLQKVAAMTQAEFEHFTKMQDDEYAHSALMAADALVKIAKDGKWLALSDDLLLHLQSVLHHTQDSIKEHIATFHMQNNSIADLT